MLLLGRRDHNGRQLMASAKRLAEELGLHVTCCAVISRGLSPVRAHSVLAAARTSSQEN